MPDQYALEITWEVPDMPRLVGPFATRAEAQAFAELNVPNGSFEVCPITRPYPRRTEAKDA